MAAKQKISKLTDAQQKALETYKDKWQDIGTSTQPCNRAECEEGVRLAYQLGGLKPPKLIIWRDSPMAGAITAYCLQNGIDPESVDYKNPTKNLLEKAKEQIWQAGYGQHDANWLATYDFFRNELGLVEETAKLEGLLKITCGWWWPFEEVCVLTERHSELHRNSAGQLHRDGGPAVVYKDGFGIYALNGIRVPRWLSETPADKLDGKKVLSLKNVDQRREAVRKMGSERLINSLSPKVIDTQKDLKGGEYVLYALKVEPGEPAFKYLKMDNPSIGLVHVECVPFEIETVQQANNWRATRDAARTWNPSQLA